MIIEDILYALKAFEVYGKPAGTIFLGEQRLQELQRVLEAYGAEFNPNEGISHFFMGLPVTGGDFPQNYIGFKAGD